MTKSSANHPFTTSRVSRRGFLQGSAATLAVSGLLGERLAQAKEEPVSIAQNEPVGETVNIGFLAALTGPDSGWGLPGITGNQIFIDRVNAEGGLLVGGKRYPLKMYAFDDEAVASKALQGAKQLVLENEVIFISAIGGNPADATHPFLTQHRVIYSSLIATDIMPTRPYLIAGGDVTPRIDMLRPLYVKYVAPDLKRWAVTSQDDTIGITCQAWEVGSAMADGWDVVYDKSFSMDTTDFAPVVTAILATKPDAVSLNLTWPNFVTLIIEQLYHQGFEGIISSNYIDTESVLQKVPAEYMEATKCANSFPTFDDPWWGEPSWQHTFYRDWMARYGPGGPEDVHRRITGIDWDHVINLKVWAEGAQLAGSFDNDAILEALRAQDQFDTILGPAKMRGKDMWGIDNMISPPVPIAEVKASAKEKRIQAQWRYEDWFEQRKDAIIKVVEDKGQMWHQRA